MIAPRIAFGVLLLGLIAFRGLSLAAYWWEQPATRLGWLAFAIWLAPLACQFGRRSVDHWSRGTAGLLSLAISSCVAGLVTDVNAGFSIAIAISLVGLNGWNLASVGAIVASFAWMPLFDVIVDWPSEPATALRFALACIPAFTLLWDTCMVRSDAPLVRPVLAEISRPSRRSQRWRRGNGAWCLAGLASVFVVGIGVWIQQRSTETIEVREFSAIVDIPMKGLDYVSTTMPLDPTERVALGPQGFAVRRYVQFRGVPFIVTLIDASTDPHAIHPPTLCMGSAGWQTRQAQAIPTPGGDVRLIEMIKNRKGNPNHRQLAYWFRQKGERHASFTKYRWQHFFTRICFWSPPRPSTFVMVHFLDTPAAPTNEETVRSVLEGCSLFASL